MKNRKALFFSDVTAIVVAGGYSRRMGRDKTALPVDGRPLIQFVIDQLRPHFPEILISARTDDQFADLGVKVIPDKKPGLGPLMGLISTITVSSNDLNFVQACDIPFTNFRLIQKLIDQSINVDAAAPQTPKGHYEPLFAVYRKSILPIMEEILQFQRGQVHQIFKKCRHSIIQLLCENEISNLNTISEYQQFISNMKKPGC